MPRDAESLERMFSRCSADTIYLRFHLAFPKVPRTMLDRLADVDPRIGKSFVAEAGGEVVGHAMYAKDHEGDREADTAVVVEDGRASRGVGRRLFVEICEQARRDGVETLLCTTFGNNYKIWDAVRCSFPEAQITFSVGMCDIRLPLELCAKPPPGGAPEGTQIAEHGAHGAPEPSGRFGGHEAGLRPFAAEELG